MATAPQPEVWLRGPITGVPAELQPVAHALTQALEDVERMTSELSTDDLWWSPGGAASIGFHLRHMAGSLDRLMTYARGEPLSDEQRASLKEEKEQTPTVIASRLLEELRTVIESAVAQLRSTAVDRVDEARAVGRAGYPSSVRGLLYHAGEHTARHAGQISTTVKVVKGLRG